MAESNLTMKLLIDTKRNRVMFAEAWKECVDFLFHILALPIGSVIRLLTSKGMVGCLGNLYESLQNLDNMYIQPNQEKDILLKSKTAQGAASVPLLSLTNTPAVKQFYTCRNHRNYVAEDIQAFCPSCRESMRAQLEYVAPAAGGNVVASNGGLVKEVVIYMVLDDLVVKPMSTVSSITLLNQFSVKDVGVLKVKVVTFGMDQALKMLRASLQSKNVLTSVFMDNINE